MIPETHPTPERVGGDGLLLTIAIAVVAVVVAEAAFVAIGGFVVMIATIFLALAVTSGVIYAVMRTMDGDQDA